MQYRIGDPIIVKGKIVGYDALGSDGKVKHLRLADVVAIAKNKQINATAVTDDNGEEHIAIIGDKYEAQDEAYMIQSRVLKDGKLVSYRCKIISTGEYRKIQASKLWELASKGQVLNAEAKVLDKSLVLVGKGCKLSDLPEMRI